MIAGFQCAGCGEWNETTVDSSAGRQQSYVEDTVLPLVVRKLAQVLPNAETRTFFGAGHVPHLNYPREYVEAVKTFARV